VGNDYTNFKFSL
jgi:hypothetical protein